MSKKIAKNRDQWIDSKTGEVLDGEIFGYVDEFSQARSGMDFRRPGAHYDSDIGGESLTKQEFKDLCDVNKIVANFTRPDQVRAFVEANRAYLAVAQGIDVTELPQNYHEALNLINATENAFWELPAEHREAYGNDPMRFLEAAAKSPDLVFGERGENGDPVKVPPVPATPEASAAKVEPTPDKPE